MNWLRMTLHTVWILLVVSGYSWYRWRAERMQTTQQPSYGRLLVTRRVFFFYFFFSVPWIGFVAPQVDWSFFGEWTGLIYATLFIAVVWVSMLVFVWLERRKANESER